MNCQNRNKKLIKNFLNDPNTSLELILVERLFFSIKESVSRTTVRTIWRKQKLAWNKSSTYRLNGHVNGEKKFLWNEVFNHKNRGKTQVIERFAFFAKKQSISPKNVQNDSTAQRSPPMLLGAIWSDAQKTLVTCPKHKTRRSRTAMFYAKEM